MGAVDHTAPSKSIHIPLTWISCDRLIQSGVWLWSGMKGMPGFQHILKIYLVRVCNACVPAPSSQHFSKPLSAITTAGLLAYLCIESYILDVLLCRIAPVQSELDFDWAVQTHEYPLLQVWPVFAASTFLTRQKRFPTRGELKPPRIMMAVGMVFLG